jgi:hypothetical protein
VWILTLALFVSTRVQGDWGYANFFGIVSQPTLIPISKETADGSSTLTFTDGSFKDV